MGYVQQEVNMTLLVVACDALFARIACELACLLSLACLLLVAIACLLKTKICFNKNGKERRKSSHRKNVERKKQKRRHESDALSSAPLSLQPIINNQWQCPPKRVSTQSTYYLNSSAEFYVFKTIFTIHSYHHQ